MQAAACSIGAQIRVPGRRQNAQVPGLLGRNFRVHDGKGRQHPPLRSPRAIPSPLPASVLLPCLWTDSSLFVSAPVHKDCGQVPPERLPACMLRSIRLASSRSRQALRPLPEHPMQRASRQRVPCMALCYKVEDNVSHLNIQKNAGRWY